MNISDKLWELKQRIVVSNWWEDRHELLPAYLVRKAYKKANPKISELLKD